jgi:hypothetical protein
VPAVLEIEVTLESQWKKRSTQKAMGTALSMGSYVQYVKKGEEIKLSVDTDLTHAQVHRPFPLHSAALLWLFVGGNTIGSWNCAIMDVPLSNSVTILIVTNAFWLSKAVYCG